MYLSVLAALAVVIGAPGTKVPKPHPIVGTWLILTQTHEGRTIEVQGNHCWTFTADGRRGGHTIDTKPTEWQKYEVDAKARSQALNITHEYGTHLQTEYFLFEIDGDTLTLCLGNDGLRPKAIAESGNRLFKLRRVNAKK